MVAKPQGVKMNNMDTKSSTDLIFKVTAVEKLSFCFSENKVTNYLLIWTKPFGNLVMYKKGGWLNVVASDDLGLHCLLWRNLPKYLE